MRYQGRSLPFFLVKVREKSFSLILKAKVDQMNVNRINVNQCGRVCHHV